MLKLEEYQGAVIECTRCKVRSILPANGVLGLKKNYDLLMEAMKTNEDDRELCNFCIRKLVYPPRTVTLICSDCQVMFCGLCSDEIHEQLEFRMHNIRLITADLKNNETVARQEFSGFIRKGRPTLKRYNSSLDALPGQLIILVT